MRSLSGFVLLAGVGVGLFVYLPAPVDHDTSLNNARVLGAARPHRNQPSTVLARQQARSFSPAIPLTTPADREASTRTASTAQPANTAGSWQTAVALTQASAESPYRSLDPTNPTSRYKLVVDIQQELKRVGCYYGRIDGSWGPGSKYAMQEFMDRVNATLPVDKPDYLLLTLLQAQTQGAKTCGACPSGQVLSGGRCVPQSVVANAQRTESRYGMTPAATSPWQTTTTAAAQPATKPLFTPVPTSVISSEPLPGRMAIGGPKELPPVDSVYTQPTAGVATATVGQSTSVEAAAATVNPSAQEPQQQRTTSYKRRRRTDGPGTPRYNLLLSLGGVF